MMGSHQGSKEPQDLICPWVPYVHFKDEDETSQTRRGEEGDSAAATESDQAGRHAAPAGVQSHPAPPLDLISGLETEIRSPGG